MIVLREVKGTPLTIAELDNNFDELWTTKNHVLRQTGLVITDISVTKFDGMKLLIKIPASSGGNSVTWDPMFRPFGFDLPTVDLTTPQFLICIYNAQDLTWDVLGAQ